MGIRVWVKEQVAKLRRSDNQQQLQAVEPRGSRGCSVLFARARKHHNETRSRKATRSRSNPETRSRRHSDESEAAAQWKPCVQCTTRFQTSTSKYLDYCSTECKTKAFVERDTTGEAPSRASEWI